MVFPARSEIIRQFEIKGDGEILIPNQQVEEGVYIANTITEATNCYVRLLNTKATSVTIKKFQIKYDNLNDYDIINTKNNKHDKKNEIIKKLRKTCLYFAKSM